MYYVTAQDKTGYWLMIPHITAVRDMGGFYLVYVTSFVHPIGINHDEACKLLTAMREF